MTLYHLVIIIDGETIKLEREGDSPDEVTTAFEASINKGRTDRHPGDYRIYCCSPDEGVAAETLLRLGLSGKSLDVIRVLRELADKEEGDG